VDNTPSKAPPPEAASANASDTLSHEAYISRAQALLETGQITAAKRHFEQALFVRPNSNQAHTGLGYVALEKNRPQLAIEHFTAAMRSGNDDALIGLGDAYRRLGRNREALRAYQNYLSRKPNGDQVSIARAQVDRLGDELGLARKSP
jgi:tetratricopeptide (TPR) repeat protein